MLIYSENKKVTVYISESLNHSTYWFKHNDTFKTFLIGLAKTVTEL